MPSSPRIEPTLRRLLTDREASPFSRDELLKDYCALKLEHGRTDRASRQFIDRNLNRLSSRGVLTRIHDHTDGIPRYEYSRKASSLLTPPTNQALTVLRQKLHHHRVELLSTLGETEVYDEVCADLPYLQPSIQSQYDEARDRSLKLLGRIRALETLIAAQSVAPS